MTSCRPSTRTPLTPFPFWAACDPIPVLGGLRPENGPFGRPVRRSSSREGLDPQQLDRLRVDHGEADAVGGELPSAQFDPGLDRQGVAGQAATGGQSWLLDEGDPVALLRVEVGDRAPVGAAGPGPRSAARRRSGPCADRRRAPRGRRRAGRRGRGARSRRGAAARGGACTAPPSRPVRRPLRRRGRAGSTRCRSGRTAQWRRGTQRLCVRPVVCAVGGPTCAPITSRGISIEA